MHLHVLPHRRGLEHKGRQDVLGFFAASYRATDSMSFKGYSVKKRVGTAMGQGAIISTEIKIKHFSSSSTSAAAAAAAAVALQQHFSSSSNSTLAAVALQQQQQQQQQQ